MSLSKLSQFTAWLKYAKFLPEKGRREIWEETVWRNANMHLEKFRDKPDICKEIRRVYRDFVVPMKVLPSARSLQYAGDAITDNNARMYNCGFVAVDDLRALDEIPFQLMSGCGMGFTVEKHVIAKLPKATVPTEHSTVLIPDTKEGWAESFRQLIGAYFGLNPKPNFDYSAIRPAGAPLKLSGGTASGPAVLRNALEHVEKILSKLKTGDSLSSLQIFDIVCHTAMCVVAGGSRRSSLICLFSPDDQEMLSCKEPKNIGTENYQRFCSNNSAVFYRDTTTQADFDKFWAYASTQKTGDPGVFWSNDRNSGTNPCVEVGLYSGQFCCLVEINGSTVVSQQDFEERCYAASFIATLQASYTDFKYVRPLWKEQTEKEALIGVGVTGICTGKVSELNLIAGSQVVKDTNAAIAERIGINKSPRSTVVKPAGTTSLLARCSSGVHPWYSKRYRRRITVAHIEPVYKFLQERVPKALDPKFAYPDQSWINFPVVAPENSITREEKLEDMLERVRRWNTEWIAGGHRGGSVHNNVSATVYLQDSDWDTLKSWMWKNRFVYNGLAFFPKYDDSSHPQLPHEDCSPEEIEEMERNLADLDLSQFIEGQNNTNFMGEAACTGESCEIPIRHSRANVEQISV